MEIEIIMKKKSFKAMERFQKKRNFRHDMFNLNVLWVSFFFFRILTFFIKEDKLFHFAKIGFKKYFLTNEILIDLKAKLLSLIYEICFIILIKSSHTQFFYFTYTIEKVFDEWSMF